MCFEYLTLIALLASNCQAIHILLSMLQVIGKWDSIYYITQLDILSVCEGSSRVRAHKPLLWSTSLVKG